MPKFNHVHTISAEIEGHFENIPDDTNAFLKGIKGDGSIELYTEEERRIHREKQLITGERNGEITPINQIAKLRRWVQKYWPVIVNRSCGFHCHAKMKDHNIQNQVINSPHFHKAFIKAAQEFVQKPKYKFKSTVIDRALHGNNYARLDYRSDPEHGSCAIDPSTRYNTIEFRLFSGDITSRQAKLILTFISTFLENYVDEHFMKKASEKVGLIYKSYNGESL